MSGEITHKYKKPKLYKGGSLQGLWKITIKIDGIRAFLEPNGKAFSRANKELYNLGEVLSAITKSLDVEIFCGSFKETVQILRSSKGEVREVLMSEVYSLDPLDSRLNWGTFEDPSESFIKKTLKEALENGHEGLVLRQGDKWLKVKNKETFDVHITGIIEGKGKYKGMLGAFMTSKGKVGTGFTDEDRKKLYDKSLIGVMLEVECMEITEDGKFRHPRFKRLRWDKDE